MTAAQREPEDDGAYRAEVRAWLDQNATEFAATKPSSDADMVQRSKVWARKRWEAGYTTIALDAGDKRAKRRAAIFSEEERRYNLPLSLGPGSYLAMVALEQYGTPEQLKKWGSLTESGSAFWCQLFSEPSAGSDLGALRTRAVRDGDQWIVNGQKVWSSWAHHSDYGILLARTDPTVPKHKGISFFMLDMRQPGITVRPIRQITGHSDFNEVFIVDAVVKEEDRIGAEGQGWEIAMTLLAAERRVAGSMAPASEGEPPTSTRNLVRQARAAKRGQGSALDSAAVRAKLAQWYVEEQGTKNYGRRLQKEVESGNMPPPTLPILKLVNATRGQQVHAFLMDLDEFGGLFQEADAPGDKFYDYLWSAVMRIAGGADEVLRNQLSERALQMPGDQRNDKDVPFEKLPF